MTPHKDVAEAEKVLVDLYREYIQCAITEIDEGVRPSTVVKTLDGTTYDLERRRLHRDAPDEVYVFANHSRYGLNFLPLSGLLDLTRSDAKEAINLYHQFYKE